MAKHFTFDTSGLDKLMQKSPGYAALGARRAMEDIKDDWVAKSRDNAPLDSNNLRRQIEGEVAGKGFDSEVIVASNSTNDTGGKPFNYSYYIHEKDAGGDELRTEGTVKKFFDETGENREEEWERWLDEEIREALKNAGW